MSRSALTSSPALLRMGAVATAAALCLGSAPFASAAGDYCVPASSVLCLNDGRFKVEVDWEDHQGRTGEGLAAPFLSSDTGIFYFFDPGNWEMTVKVLNGCGVNGRFWVFVAATTDVGYNLRITDTQTGTVKTYTNELGTAAAATADTEAFGGCGASATSAVDLGMSSDRGITRVRSSIFPALKQLGTCFPGSTNMCLNDSRFMVQVRWKDHAGNTGTGKVVPYGTPDAGIFWFFNDNNWEMLVKVLDACGLNDSFWVFSAATTDVQYTLTVTDTLTGEVKEYKNALGTLAPAITDTSAFKTCSAEPVLPPSIEFVGDRSLVLEGKDETATLEVNVYDSSGVLDPSASVSWTSSNPSLVSVTKIGARRAEVRAEANTVGSCEIIASYEGVQEAAGIGIARPKQGAILLSSSVVRSMTGDTVVLDRNSQTLSISPGDVVATGSEAGLLATVVSVDDEPSQVVLGVTSAALTDVFEELDFSSQGKSVRVEGQFDQDGRTWMDVRTAEGQLLYGKVAGAFQCKNELDKPFDLKLTGTDVSFSFDLTPHVDLRISNGGVQQFKVFTQGDLDLTAQIGSLEFAVVLSDTITCSAELGSLVLPGVNVYGFNFAIGLTPILGIEATVALEAANLKIGGPVGTVRGTVRSGIQYSGSSGWGLIASEDWSGDLGLSPPTLDLATFTASTEPFGKLDFGLRVDLGVPPLALNLADLRFAEVKGFGYLDFELPANAARGPSHRLYEGPEWDLGLGVNGSVKAELKGGLGEVLDAVGIGSPFNLSLELFDVRNELLSSPKVRISATPGLAALEDQISVLVTTDGNHSGRFDLWSSSDGANELESLGSGEIKRGQGTQAIQGETLGEGDHRILPRLTVDAVSSVLPYATGVGADVSVGSGGSDPPETITLTLPGGVPLEMVYLPPGTFTMGSPRDERGRLYDSEDLHEVTLTRGYYLGRYEITIRQWEAVMGLDPCGFAGCEYLDYPVIWVSWNDVCGGTTGSDCAADSFIGKLNAYLGTTKFRLPTEAEWERAARAGTETPFSFGDDESCDLIDCSYCHLFDDYMVWCGNAGEMPYWPGVKLPNGFGLYDMHGNVFEWTADWFTQHLGTAPVTDPINLDEGEWQEKVMRGGAWTFPAHFCRSAMRVSYTPDGISRDVGFRLAKSP